MFKKKDERTNVAQRLQHILWTDLPDEHAPDHARTLTAKAIAERVRKACAVGVDGMDMGSGIRARLVTKDSPRRMWGVQLCDGKMAMPAVWMEGLVEEIGAIWAPKEFVRAVEAEFDLMRRMDAACDYLNCAMPWKSFVSDYAHPYAPYIMSDVSIFGEALGADTAPFRQFQRKYAETYPEAAERCREAERLGCGYHELFCREEPATCSPEGHGGAWGAAIAAAGIAACGIAIAAWALRRKKT